MTAGNISYSHGTAIGLECSAAMMAILLMSRRRTGRARFDDPSQPRLAHHSRQIIRMMLVALMGCSLPCGAVSLGDATLLSSPAQPLRVEIELASDIQPGLRVKLASEQAFRENGIAYPDWLGHAQVSLLQAQGLRRRAALLLQAPQAAQAQLVELVLEFSWPTGSSQQPYVLLLDDANRSREPAAPLATPAPVVMAEATESHTTARPETLEPIAESVKPILLAEPKVVPATRPEAARPPAKKREHAGAVSTRRPAAARPTQDRLRLAKARSAQADRIAQERREADQQARMRELELNARQMRELAEQVAATTPPAHPPRASASAAALAPAPMTVAPAPKAADLPSQKPAAPGQRAAIWPWVLAGLTVPLVIVWTLRFWLARRRPEFTDSVGVAGSVFELSPAEAERAYSDYMQQRQAPVRADASPLEEARALFVVGRFGDAQQQLDSVLRENPRNHEAWFLQARVLCAQGDSAGLARRMPLIKKLTGETGELWDRVLVLGHELDPGNPLYQAAQPAAPQPPVRPLMPETSPPPATKKPPATTTASSAVDDALRMATAYGARPA